MRNRITTEVFIQRSKAFFGDKYDYSQTVYLSSSKKVVIICPKHGQFEVRASEHMAGIVSGCKACSGNVLVNLQEFIDRSNIIFNSKYDYSLISEVSSGTKVRIICPIHGEFSLRASEHYSGPKRGCPNCLSKSNKRNKIDTREFIIRSRDVHGDIYDYSKSIYISANQKVTVICPKHGEFEIRASAHYGSQKQGCASCGGRGGVSTETFIHKSKKKFGDRFTYENTIYTNSHKKVIINCKIHGDFEIAPTNHLSGNGGCKACSGRPEINTNIMVKMLKEHFGKRYDYTKVDYNGVFSNITLICQQHGPFEKTPHNVFNSEGCPHCIKYTFNDFFDKAKKIHGNKYDYSLVNYTTTKDFVDIVCPKHGPFSQTPNRHLDGRGCPTCGIIANLLSNRAPTDPCNIYYLKLEYKGHNFWKIGITSKSLQTRFRLLIKDNVEIVESNVQPTTIGCAIEAESKILKMYKEDLEYRGHILLHAKGGTECFRVDVLGRDNKSLKDFL